MHFAPRRLATLAACGLALAFAPAARADSEGPPKRPNILLIYTDDQRWDTVAALGNPEIQTPNLDKLVHRGYHFNNAFCMGSMIGAVCLPSRTMMITGRSLWRIPENPRAKVAPPGVQTLPALLNEAGYATFHCGKAGNSCTFANAQFTTNIETKNHTIPSAGEHADEAITFLGTQHGEKPFFMYIAPPVPHDPRVAPEEFVQLYSPDKVSLSKNFMAKHPYDNGDLYLRDEVLAPHPRTEAVMRQHLADYYASVSDLDHMVGRIVAELEKKGVLDKTIILYSSDQGLAVGGRHGLMGKQNLYEHVKPPLIVAGPGIPHGQSDALVYLYDLFPTICDLAGVKTPDVAEGKSLLPVMLGKQARVRETLFGAYRASQRMIRDERWKLMKYHAGGVKAAQLFDLKADPDEVNNLIDDPKYAAERDRLEKRLAEARKQFADPIDFEGAGGPKSVMPGQSREEKAARKAGKKAKS